MSMNDIVKKAGELIDEVGKTVSTTAQKMGTADTVHEASSAGSAGGNGNNGNTSRASTLEDVIVVDSNNEAKLLDISRISYAMHTIVAVAAVLPGMQPSTLLLVLAFVLDMWKRGDAQGTWLESHFRWRVHTVVWAMILYAVTSWLWALFIIPGWIAWGIISIWFLYRIVRGFSALGARQPMPV